MANVTANGIQMKYDTFDDRSSSVLLLIASNGANCFSGMLGFANY